MKTLTLIRHAKSSHENPAALDFHRTLNPRGRRDAPRMGRYLREELAWSPDQIISSPATRAITTARLIAEESGYDVFRIRQDESIYEAPVRNLLQVISDAEETIEHLCLVGHNPGMENLANWLLGERGISAMVTCGVAILELNVPNWTRLKEKCATLKHFLQPKVLWVES